MKWSVESYQLAFFHAPQMSHDAFQVWLSLFETTPDTYQRNPDPSQRGAQAGGMVAGYQWMVQTALGRTDLFVHGTPDGDPEMNPSSMSFPVMKQDEAAKDLLTAKGSTLQMDHLGVTRLAFVSQLFVDTSSQEESNRLFCELSNTAPTVDGATDLTFIINVRKSLADSGVQINRLCRWQTVEKQLIAIPINGPGTSLPTITQKAVSLNIDINTVPQQAPFKVGEVPKMIAEIIAESQRVRAEGFNALTS